MGLFTKLFGTRSEREVKKLEPQVEAVMALEEPYKKLTDQQLREKTQEFKDRRTYDVAASKLTHSGVPAQKADSKISPAQSCEEIRLFVTKTCPNCKLAKEYLKGINYLLIDAEENMELAAKYGVMQAPTLVVVQGDQVKKYVNASRIKQFADSFKEVLV